MEPERFWTFGPFRLDTQPPRLWRGDHVMALRPRSLAVLQYLVAHAGRLVTKTELMQQVWAGTHVDQSVLRGCIREIRAVLGDAATAPQYVETVGRHGYRLLVGRSGHIPDPVRKGPVIGRQDDIAFLHQVCEQAANGSRQLVFVSGEAGIGKTTLADLFMTSTADGRTRRIGRGQCLEHDRRGEPYLPVLEALGQWGRAPDGAAFLAVLKRYAPTWLAQFPAFVSEGEAERLAREAHGLAPWRMLRELAEMLEILSADTPLVLVLEDLHWSDTATTELLAYLAQRREPARLLILGTYRPEEAVVRGHPLRRMIQELRGRDLCHVLTLERLTAQEVSGYVRGWFNGQVADTLFAMIYRRTEGNPLFMVNMLAHLAQQGMVTQVGGQWAVETSLEAVEASIPEGVRHLIARRIEALPDDMRQILEVASVVGDAFAAAVVAAVTAASVEAVEAIYDDIVRQGYFIVEAGMATWPDGR